MSHVKTDKLSARTASGTITLGESGETLTIPSGVVLTNNGTASGFGKVLQVLVNEYATATTIATTTYTDVGLSQAITPSSTSSKILCIWTMQATIVSDRGWGVQLVRDSTNIYTSNNLYDVYMPSSTGSRLRGSYIHLDSPNTTSSVTYKVQVATYASGSVEFNDDNAQTQLLLMEIGA